MFAMGLSPREILQVIKGEAGEATRTRFVAELRDPQSTVSKVVEARAKRAREVLGLGRPEVLAGEDEETLSEEQLRAENERIIAELGDDFVD